MSGVCSIRRCPVGPAGWHDPGEVRTSVDISRVSDKSWPLRVSCCQLLLPTSGRHSPSAPRVALRSGGCGSSVVVCSSGRRAAAHPETAPAPPPRLCLRGAAWPARSATWSASRPAARLACLSACRQCGWRPGGVIRTGTNTAGRSRERSAAGRRPVLFMQSGHRGPAAGDDRSQTE